MTRIISLIILLLTIFSASGAGDGERADSLTVSLLTCYPGPEVYELCGHEAVRIRGVRPDGVRIDSVWNYGLFDFTQKDFIYRFVKGETDYMVGGYPYMWFLPEYVARGSKVVEQDLNLSAGEAFRLLGLLRTESLPENRTYRYNYVRDNCATRIVDRLEDATGRRLALASDTTVYGTWRKEMRSYHRDYPWYQFGIDLALGSGLDRPITAREEMFAPVDMMERISTARLSDGRQLVKATRVLNEGRPDATLGPTPWWRGPTAFGTAVFLLAVILAVYEFRKGRAVRWANALWFLICGAAGCVIFFLVFYSAHEATSPNVLLIWLNPLQLLIPATLWWRRTRIVARCVAWYDVVAVVTMLTVWPMQTQSASPAVFPLAAATATLALAYAITSREPSYNKKGEAA